MTATAAQILDLLRSSSRIVLTGHEHPDGDCLGAQAGLFHLIRSWGGEVRIVNPDPPAAYLGFLGEDAPYEAHGAGEAAPSCDLLVLLDCAQLRRVGALGRAFGETRPTRIVVIDHHVGSESGDGDDAFVDVTAAATGEMVMRLYDAAGVEPGAAAARGLFVSLVADTGWFRYSNTTPAVFERAARLTASGVDAAAVYDAMHRRNHPDSVGYLGRSIGASEILLDGRLGMLRLDPAAIARGAELGVDLDLVMEPLRSVAGIEVVSMLKQSEPGSVKVSLRSQGAVDVQQIAARLGGGGHRKAAGATVAGELDEVAERVQTLVVEVLGTSPAGGGDR